MELASKVTSEGCRITAYLLLGTWFVSLTGLIPECLTWPGTTIYLISDIKMKSNPDGFIERSNSFNIFIWDNRAHITFGAPSVSDISQFGLDGPCRDG